MSSVVFPATGGALPLAPVQRAFESVGNATGAPSAGEGVPFVDVFKGAVETHMGHKAEAEGMEKAFIAGQLDDIHGTMIASKMAGIELRVLANVRTKLVEAFNDLWRMSV